MKSWNARDQTEKKQIVSKTEKTWRSKQMALISIKDVKQAIRIMMQILEKLDEIYHALHDSINDKEGE